MTDKAIVEVLARDVMGWMGCCEGDCWDTGEGLQVKGLWNPLESWADAGMVAEALAKVADVTIRKPTWIWHCDIRRKGSVMPRMKADASDQSAPRAISLAAVAWAQAQKEREGV